MKFSQELKSVWHKCLDAMLSHTTASSAVLKSGGQIDVLKDTGFIGWLNQASYLHEIQNFRILLDNV